MTVRRAVLALPGSSILESLGPISKSARYSVYGVDPCRSLIVEAGSRRDPFAWLAEEGRPWRRRSADTEFPFTAGWIGYLSYEAGRFVEPNAFVGASDHDLPVACFSLHDTLLIHDRPRGDWRLVASELPVEVTRGARPSAAARIDRWSAWFETHALSARPPDRPVATAHAGKWNDTSSEYLAKVRRALEYITAGDVFQVNLARRFRAPWVDTAGTLYERLCVHNQSAYAAYLPIDANRAVLSSSPELLLSLRDGLVETRPIKGTRPRRGREFEDAAAQRDLQTHPKDRAELNMIVDLLRNDLGRVCRYGSVDVVCDGEIEVLPTVFHRTATIRGRLREACDAIDLLRATFPGGSVTGAPKVRAMQIIRDLEGFARGPYCGTIGWIGLDGSMQMNLAIRTLALHDGVVDLCVGSGIVADSDPDDEHDELAAKAAGMMEALGVDVDAGEPLMLDRSRAKETPVG